MPKSKRSGLASLIWKDEANPVASRAEAYNWYAGMTEGIAAIGSTVLGLFI